MSESLRRHHMAQRMPHKMTTMRKLSADIRAHLRVADEHMKRHEWADVQQVMMEVVAMATEMEVFANENVVAQ